MRITNRLLTWGILVLFLLVNAEIFAQEKKSHVVEVVKFQTKYNPNGSIKERDSILTEYVNNVIKKNDLIVGYQIFFHYYGSDSRDMLILNEYKSFEDLLAAGKKNSDLFKQFIPDKAKRTEFNKKFWSYYERFHSDEIYSSMLKFKK